MLENGSIRLFRIAGIDVLLHWSWAVVAYFQLMNRVKSYGSAAWPIAEYLTLFGIVLLHEFGHALACRSVGGKAERIVLWPLGGIAFVNPPPRPGAVLWSIAAGPLVNVALLPLTIGIALVAWSGDVGSRSPDLMQYLEAIAVINGALLVFNLIPVYPLDGGQIVQALLWFVAGRALSLKIVSVIGLVVGPSLLVLFLTMKEVWLAVIAGFIVLQSLNGFRAARVLSFRDKVARHPGLACPSCSLAPPAGPFWGCDECGEVFDTFEQHAVCPNCCKRFPLTMCPECRQRHPIHEWWGSPIPVVDISPREPGAADQSRVVN